MSLSLVIWLFAVTALAILGAASGLWLAGSPKRSRRIVTFSGGLLIGIALFWVLPELGEQLPRLLAAGLVFAGFGLLWLVDRYVTPVCPTCSHTHDHEHCVPRLHGFGAPLIIAAVAHSFFDGWGIVIAQAEGNSGLGLAFLLGALAHKLPEGLAYGSILRSSFNSSRAAFFWVTAVEAVTILGGVIAALSASYFTPTVLSAVLCLACGTFLYLGYHAVDSEWKRTGPPSLYPALTGAAGAAAIQQGLRVFLR